LEKALSPSAQEEVWCVPLCERRGQCQQALFSEQQPWFFSFPDKCSLGFQCSSCRRLEEVSMRSEDIAGKMLCELLKMANLSFACFL
jgi:hypothetical protein